MSVIEKPYVLYVAELIYTKICKIKKQNPYLSNINAFKSFIATNEYEEISSGKFHEKWMEKLKRNKFIDPKTKKKIPHETIKLLQIQKNIMINLHQNCLKEYLIICGGCVKVMNYGVRKLNKNI